jgi:hypothetical protein
MGRGHHDDEVLAPQLADEVTDGVVGDTRKMAGSSQCGGRREVPM